MNATIMEQAISQAHFLQIPKGNFLFYQGSISSEYFLLINGRISLRLIPVEQALANTFSVPKSSKKSSFHSISRKRLSFLKPLKRNSQADIEKRQISSGQFFGESELLFNSPRETSAYAIEDSIVLCFPKEIFTLFLSHHIIKKENDIKDFISSKIKPFAHLSKKEYELYYRDIKKIYPTVNQEIFHEEEKADCFYLIYQGKCCIRKKICGNINILLLDKGDIVGLDVLSDQGKYTYTMISGSNSTILFQFNLSEYHAFFIGALTNGLLPYYQKQNRIIREYLQKHINLQIKMNKQYKNITGNKDISSDTENIDKEIVKLNKVKVSDYNKNGNILKLNKKLFLKTRNIQSALSLSTRIGYLSTDNMISSNSKSKIQYTVTNQTHEESNTAILNKKYKSERKKMYSLSKIPKHFFSTEIKGKNSSSNFKSIYKKNNNKLQMFNKNSILSILDDNIEQNLKRWRFTNNKNSHKLFETDNFKLPLYVLSK